jgi:uncharacterized membrane-anchored protein
MAIIDLENPWVFTGLMAAVGMVTYGLIETVFFDGDLLSAIIQGCVGGLAFGVVYVYVRRNAED